VTQQQGDPTPKDTGNADAGRVLDRALDLVRFLRARCPWGAAQTPTSLLPYLLEETHEVADAVTRGDDPALRDELGDLLLNVAFQIVLAEERLAFDAGAVVATLEAKMRRRHPHLYGDGPAEPWEAVKARERGADNCDASLLDGMAHGLDPLSRAQRIQDRVSAVGFDWADAHGAFTKVAEELAEVREATTIGGTDVEEELGDLLFAVVNLTRLSGAHAMRALQRANAKFSDRFRALETLARARGLALDTAGLEALDALWDEVKREERRRPRGVLADEPATDTAG
jgi:ATP diphosphatase